jgi:hypothetical protein
MLGFLYGLARFRCDADWRTRGGGALRLADLTPPARPGKASGTRIAAARNGKAGAQFLQPLAETPRLSEAV